MAKKFSISKNKKNDILLVFAVLLITVTGMIIINITGQEGNTVCVKVDGKQIMSYNISEDTDTVIHTDKNGENRLVIKDGKVSISEANCPDKICVKHRQIENVNESIICLPHKVVVEIVSKNQDVSLDAAV